MARPGRWTVAQLEAAIDGALAGASYKTVEWLTGVPAATIGELVALRADLVALKADADRRPSE